MQKIIEALENKHPGSKVICVHISPPVIEITSEMEEQLAQAITDAEEVGIRTAFS